MAEPSQGWRLPREGNAQRGGLEAACVSRKKEASSGRIDATKESGRNMGG